MSWGYKPRIRDYKHGRYRAMVKYKSCVNPISVGSEDDKERAIYMAKCTTKFERVWVVDTQTGRIVWERRMKDEPGRKRKNPRRAADEM